MILAVEAHEKLIAEGIRSRVVSMPSWEIFEQQTARVSGQRSAARRDGAYRDRAGLDVRMGAICRQRRAASSAWRPSVLRRR